MNRNRFELYRDLRVAVDGAAQPNFGHAAQPLASRPLRALRPLRGCAARGVRHRAKRGRSNMSPTDGSASSVLQWLPPLAVMPFLTAIVFGLV